VPNQNYQRGYRLEYRTRKMLEGMGWKVLRSPSSKGEADLIAFNQDSKILVQCKTTVKDALYVYGLSDLVKEAKKYKAVPILAYSFLRSPVYGVVVKNDRFNAKKRADNKKLDEILAGF